MERELETQKYKFLIVGHTTGWSVSTYFFGGFGNTIDIGKQVFIVINKKGKVYLLKESYGAD